MKDFKKYYHIPAPPHDVYAALTNPVTLQLWTGEPAVMTTEAGTEFSLWDGSIVGRNIEFTEDSKIVQQWYFDGQPEESIVTIILRPEGKGTSAELRHTNIPDKEYEGFASGWDEYYFGALATFYKD